MSGRAQLCFLLRREAHPKTQTSTVSRRVGECVETVRYLVETIRTEFSWSAHVNQVEKKEAEKLGVLSPLLNKISGFSVKTVCSSARN
jgi:hypothetical protein